MLPFYFQCVFNIRDSGFKELQDKTQHSPVRVCILYLIPSAQFCIFVFDFLNIPSTFPPTPCKNFSYLYILPLNIYT